MSDRFDLEAEVLLDNPCLVAEQNNIAQVQRAAERRGELKLADMIEARTRQAELLVSLTDERDAEKERADRAEQSLAELRAETAENFVRTFDYWQEAASELSRVTQRGAAERAALEALRGQLRFERESGTQAKSRIAELEAHELAVAEAIGIAYVPDTGPCAPGPRDRVLEEIASAVRVAGRAADLASELAEARNDLEKAQRAWTKEVAEAREVSAALVEQLRGLSAAHTSTVRDLRDRDHELSLANARGNRLQAQLTEARGELRRITESDFAHQIRLSRAVGDVKTTEVTIAALHAWRAKTSAAQSPSAKECNGPGCSYPDGCPKCNPLGTPTQSPSSADSDARECPDCYDGGACLPGGCGIDGCERCGKMCPTCNGSHELPASPPYETAPTLENGEGCPTCDSGVPCIRHLDSRHPGRVVRVESAPANPHIGSELDAAHMAEHGCVVAPGEPHDCPAVYPGDQAESRAAQSPPVTPEPMYLDPALMGRAPKPRPGFATAAELADVVSKLERLQGLVLRLWPFCDESKEIRAEREATKL